MEIRRYGWGNQRVYQIADDINMRTLGFQNNRITTCDLRYLYGYS